jgi:hypothetical protein
VNDLESISKALADYFEAVKATQANQPADLASAVTALEAHSQNPPAGLPAPLKHYLESRSYRKAWEWIHGQTPAKGTCGN